MGIYKRGKVYWFSFIQDGARYQQSTKQGNPRIARQIEATVRADLAKGDVGIKKREPCPTLREFESALIDDEIKTRRNRKPGTVEFYKYKYATLLSFEPLARCRLRFIDEALISRFVAWKLPTSSVTTVNRSLSVLRRALRLAQRSKLIDRVPHIELLDGERVRDFVLTRTQEALYLAMCPEPLKTIARFSLETGMRLGEVLALEWRNVFLDPVGNATRGYVRVEAGKTKHAQRNLSLTSQGKEILASQAAVSKSSYVFVREDGITPVSKSTVEHQHQRIRTLLKMDEDFVIHSFRHTMLTRLGERGVDAFTIMKIAGHSSIVVSQRYVHPTPETLERAFGQLEASSREAAAVQKRRAVTTIPTTYKKEMGKRVQ